jgi:hypothetical protein
MALAAACKEKVGPLDRVMRLKGLPACAAGTAYKHQAVAQFKLNAGTSETPFDASVVFMNPLPDLPDNMTLHVPTRAFTRTLQVGLCDPTPIKGGWSTQCSTPITTVFERAMTFPAGRDPIAVDVGAVVECGAPGSANVRGSAKP